MSYGYSDDLREKALAYYDRSGKSQAEVGAIFGISVRTLSDWNRKRREGDYRRRSHQKCKTPHKVDMVRLNAAITARPDAYLHELAKEFGCHASSVMRACVRAGISRKKNRTVSRA